MRMLAIFELREVGEAGVIRACREGQGDRLKDDARAGLAGGLTASILKRGERGVGERECHNEAARFDGSAKLDAETFCRSFRLSRGSANVVTFAICREKASAGGSRAEPVEVVDPGLIISSTCCTETESNGGKSLRTVSTVICPNGSISSCSRRGLDGPAVNSGNAVDPQPTLLSPSDLALV